MNSILQPISDYSTTIICFVACFHFFAFLGLIWARRKRTQKMGEALDEILRETGVATSKMAELSDDDMIDSYCQDLLGVLKDNDSAKIMHLKTKLLTFDKLKPYKKTHMVETGYNLARTLIETYPLMGILGTVIALTVGLGQVDSSAVVNFTTPLVSNSESDPIQVIDQNDNATVKIRRIIDNFGSAIKSTFAGLAFGIFFMLWNTGVQIKAAIEHT